MKIRRTEIEKHRRIMTRALDLLSDEKGNGGVRFRGKLVILHTSRRVAENVTESPYVFQHIARDMFNISNLVSRLQWMREASVRERELSERWRVYASLDVESAYVQFRSLCDHLGFLIYSSFDRIPRQGKYAQSLAKLLIWLWQHEQAVEHELVEVLERAGLGKPQEVSEANELNNAMVRNWFGHTRAIRNDIIHRGADAFVFGEPQEGILFQVFKDHLRRTIPALPHLVVDGTDLVHFDKYFSLQMANLLVFTELLSESIMRKLDIAPREAWMTGFDTIYKWMADFRNELETQYLGAED
jgi:hypothetical protein